MSGHSKWSTIKRQKGVVDAKRSQIFTKLSKALSAAARLGIDPEMNFKLRLAIDKARNANMPKENIDRAIKKGAGQEDGANVEEVIYEGYGPNGVAFLIETLTDNRNRTTANLRHLLDKHGGRLADNGSVAWMFEPKSLITVNKPTTNQEEIELKLIEAGAEEIEEMENEFLITAPSNQLEIIKQVCQTNQLIISYSSVEPVANNNVPIPDKNDSDKLDSLREALNNDDDVTNTYDNAT
ncbi:YebC/PmpR family DNA-binding transcriptional regulator [Patescibacteria group bacterium]|nr:YebC/PmpR family DNA-binding transcriptional regulator [Patescibacteria group bacterium]